MRAIFDRLRQWAVVRLIAAVAFLILALILREIVLAITRAALRPAQVPTIWLSPKGSMSYGWQGAVYALWAALVTITLGYLAYRAYVRLFERRETVELERKGAAKELGTGAFIGIAFVGVVVALLWLLGAYELTAGQPGWLTLAPAAAAATAAFMEELAVRGIFFRIIESRVGSWLALALSAVAFGAMHAGNPGASIASIAALALSAGLVLGAAFIATRRLWLPIGIHFGVNLAQGALLGLPVSGQSEPGAFSSHLKGPVLLTGGAFGMEASIFVPILSVVLGIALLWYAIRRGRIHPWPWSTKPSAL